jgi:SAM-dependent methyltransferase
MATINHAPLRDQKARRADYLPGSPPEEFIVPLLRDRIEAAIRRYAPRGGSVLDVGCGRQPFRPFLESDARTYVGLDVQQTPEGTVDFLAPIDGPLPDGLLERGPFDFILCTEVLEHVADWRPAFANLGRLLRPGGAVLLTCPHFFRLHEEPYDFWRPTLHALIHFARAEGMRPVAQEAAGDSWDVLGTLLASCCASPKGDGLAARLASKLVNGVRRALFHLLRRRWPQRLAHLRGSVYLSNVVVLERP